MALAPYSPILLGVNNEAVKEPKLCSIDFKKEIWVIIEVNFCHFKISKNQLKMVKRSKKEMFFKTQMIVLYQFYVNERKCKSNNA